MDFEELAKKRCSVRKYENRPVEQEKLTKILEVGRVAPTACNNQPQRIIVVEGNEKLDKLKKGANTFGAPLALIVCADHSQSWRRPYDGMDSAYIDATIVTDHMMLKAADMGLDSVWVCYFDPKVIRTEFNIPDDIEPVNLLIIGYGADSRKSPDRHLKERKKLTDTVVYGGF